MDYFTIPKDILKKFIEHFNQKRKDRFLKEETLCENFMLHITKDLVYAQAVTMDNIFIFAEIKTPSVKIEKEGSIPMGNLDEILKNLNHLKKSITVGIDNNVLKLTDEIGQYFIIPTIRDELIENEDLLLDSSIKIEPFRDIPKITIGEASKEFKYQLKIKDLSEIGKATKTSLKKFYNLRLSYSGGDYLNFYIGNFVSDEVHGLIKLKIEDTDIMHFDDKYVEFDILTKLEKPEIFYNRFGKEDGGTEVRLMVRNKYKDLNKAYYILSMLEEVKDEIENSES
jgi:hypothetical protein